MGTQVHGAVGPTAAGAAQEGSFVLSTLVAKGGGAVTVDGKLDEWAGAAKAALKAAEQVVVGRENWQGAKDSGGWAAARWDENYLYLAVSVTDDNFIPPPDVSYNSDTIELFLDLDLPGDIGVDSADADDIQILCALTDKGEFRYNPTGYKGVKGAAVKTADGYTIEIALPLTELKIKPKHGLVLGFDVGVDDEDTAKAGRKLQIVWTGTRDNFKDPTQYGQLVFE